ncbi:hypothetical protein EDC04DRAFT_2894411 [Pisolithus marmoratus]|nr:hypothetical protein EDC04DRAFT_2894411 [Pisolithus marmoratus]
MVYKQRKTRAGSAPPAGNSEELPATQGAVIPGTALRAGACSRCRTRKTRCEFTAGASACHKCTESGLAHECIIQASRTRPARGNSVPPVDAQQASQSRLQGKRNAHITRPTVHRQAPTKKDHVGLQGQLKLGQHDAASEQLLDSIPKVENEPPEFSSENVEHMANIFGAISAGISRDNVELENEFYGSSAEEEIDIDAAISSDSDDSLNDKSDAGSEELESEIMRRLPSNSKYHPKAVAQQAPIKAAQKQASKPKLDSENFYDPQTCPFTIQCAVRQQDGDNAPFEVPSTISLDQLRTHVAEKLGRFPGLVSLRYRLDSDKAKAELEIFKARLRSLIVPPRLANGKPSTHPPKNVLVYFEDVGSGNDGNANNSSNSNKAGTGRQAKQKQPTSSNLMQGTSHYEETFEKLQQRWRCETHSSRGSDSPSQCYTPSGGNVCYALTHSNLSFWALEIMEGKATVDVKPPTLYLHQARSRSRATAPPAQKELHTSMPQYNYPPVYVMPPWAPPMGFQHDYMQNNPTNPQFHDARPPHHATPLPLPSQRLPTAEIPDIVGWFSSLDQDEQRSKDGILFQPFGDILREKGFLRISQLSPDFVKIPDLQDWLGIEVGTAILIMQYVQEDLEMLRAGRRVFPTETNHI